MGYHFGMTASTLELLRKKAGLSQQGLADLANTTQPQIMRLERGERKLTKEWAERLARFLGVEPAALLFPTEAGEGSTLARRAVVRPPPEFLGERDLPVYAAVEGGPGEMVVSTDAIEMVPRPWFMKGKQGYAVLVVGDSMEPEFEPGDYAIVNPHLQAVRGKSAIFVSGEEHGEFRATIKRLVKATDREWHVRQFNPLRELELPRKDWTKALRVVGRYAGI